ncbi:hypothetical protein J2T12_005093 [Paenibacillus anaericanus]|uniref:hypothetical protein n=1 Tax=Paenibacillus anaericanus TaxID=170367 RepID=UPI0027801D6B|nr:hypothetical protein [Paenibacillus anaericanus]MDQ0091653.1 hypothetical protein [Paenibacillus anaericanus]
MSDLQSNLKNYLILKLRGEKGDENATKIIKEIDEAIAAVLTDEEQEVIKRTYLVRQPQCLYLISMETDMSDKTCSRRKKRALEKLELAIM